MTPALILLSGIADWLRLLRERDTQMRATIKRFLTDRSAATAVEYGILVVVLSLAIVGGVGMLGNSLQNMWGRIATSLDDSWN